MEPAVHWVMILKSLKKDSSNFTQALTNISKSQEKIFFEIINNGKDTSFGEKYDFSHISSVKDFQNRIEPQTYESLWPYIKKTTQGYQNLLTKDPIIFHELSSGSSMPAKLIPYTQKSLHALQAGILPWLHDLISSRPNIKIILAKYTIIVLIMIYLFLEKLFQLS